MMRTWIVGIAVLSVPLFPWLLTALLTGACALFEPFVPLAIGLCVDMLNYTPTLGAPYATLSGLCASVLSHVVRSRLRSSTMQS